MKLGHRAALITVAIVSGTATAAAVWVFDTLPAVEHQQAVVSAAAPVLETGSLPRGTLFPSNPSNDATIHSRDAIDIEARLSFVPPHLQYDLPSPSAADDWASAVTPHGADVPAPSWSTVTNAGRTRAAPATGQANLELLQRGTLSFPAPHARLGNVSLTTRLNEIAPTASERIAAKFKAANAPWPPSEISLVAIKDEKGLEMHARQRGGAWTFIHRYPILAASGRAGPKLTRGDKQVPEGIYKIAFLNPNSRYHVSMRVDYPNSFDRRMAAKDKRRDLGGDIMIHGKKSSAGCLAMGDEAAEELFVLAASLGVGNVKLVIAPTDFRRNAIPATAAGAPAWLPRLYLDVASAMTEYKAPPPATSGGLLSLLGL